jgi:hypothetical protein
MNRVCGVLLACLLVTPAAVAQFTPPPPELQNRIPAPLPPPPQPPIINGPLQQVRRPVSTLRLGSIPTAIALCSACRRAAAMGCAATSSRPTRAPARMRIERCQFVTNQSPPFE